MKQMILHATVIIQIWFKIKVFFSYISISQFPKSPELGVFLLGKTLVHSG